MANTKYPIDVSALILIDLLNDFLFRPKARPIVVSPANSRK